MKDSFLDFHKISDALSSCSEILKNELQSENIQIAGIREAEENLRQALSYCFSKSR